MEQLTKLQYWYRPLPRGVNVLYDIRLLLPKFKPIVVFDVGANVGQSSRQYVRWFPQTQIYCFEPVGSIFAELQRNIGGFDNIQPFQSAFSSVKGQAVIRYEGTCSTVQPLNSDCMPDIRTSVEAIDLDTIDEFCHREHIRRINFLKIDTEGHDLEVLSGAETMLSTQMIDIVQVEAGMNPKNRKFVPFEEFKRFLEDRDYYLFGIYEQVHEHYTGESHLRRANPVFISSHMIELNRFQ
ncbi:MAG: FkbM family methyltransferase [Caldilineaceae bacterium]|nr:FkbM family methyltransferase [Caldilineaceae bacterium]